MHHHCVHPVGHGEGFQVTLDGDGQRQLVDEVHGGAGNDGSAAQVLQAEHSVGSPDLLHAVPHEDDTGQLCEGLYDVEVAQWADLKERHAVLLGVRPCLLCRHLPFEGQVKSVSHQDPGHPWGMLIYFLYPSIDSIK